MNALLALVSRLTRAVQRDDGVAYVDGGGDRDGKVVDEYCTGKANGNDDDDDDDDDDASCNLDGKSSNGSDSAATSSYGYENGKFVVADVIVASIVRTLVGASAGLVLLQLKLKDTLLVLSPGDVVLPNLGSEDIKDQGVDSGV